MPSICPECKFLLFCDALYKDSIIECEDFENKQKTNADRIRAMTDEDIANFLCDIGECNRRCPAKIGDCIFSDSTCRSAWLDWLKEEANNDK